MRGARVATLRQRRRPYKALRSYITEADVKNVDIMYEAKGVGVKTTNESKERMYLDTRRLLEEDTLRLWEKCVTQVGSDKRVVCRDHSLTLRDAGTGPERGRGSAGEACTPDA